MNRRQLLAALVATPLVPHALLAAPAAAPFTSDIDVLRQAYLAMHPGLYRYATPAQVALRLDRLERDWARTEDLAARYLLLSRFLGTVKCGHTYGNFYNQTDAVKAALFQGRNRLPFRFAWIGERMIVTDGLATGLPCGTEVLTIEGRSARAILAGLLPLARADGSNDAKRRALLSVEGHEEYHGFDIYYPLVFGARDRFELSVLTPDRGRRTVRLDAIDLQARRGPGVGERAVDREGPLWRFETVGRTGVLTMPTWALFNSKWDWQAWLDARFAEIERSGVTGLVVDLRENEGGRQQCGDAVLARLTERAIAPTDQRRLVRFRRAPEALWPQLDTWDKSFRTLGENAAPSSGGFLELKPQDDAAIQPNGPRFAGRMAVLIGPQNSSATFQFAEAVRSSGLGTLVGETTGGNQRGINGGAYFFLRLPESGLEADLPLIGYYPRTPKPDAGIEPDIRMPRTPATIAAGRDVAMDAALKVARA